MGELSKDPKKEEPSDEIAQDSENLPKSAEGVVDELRKLISDLKPEESDESEKPETDSPDLPQETEPSTLDTPDPVIPDQITPEPPSALPEDPPFDGFPDDTEEKMGDAGILPEEPPQPEMPANEPIPAGGSTEHQSDEDFWSGNVLGWPSGEEEKKAESQGAVPDNLEMADPGTEEPSPLIGDPGLPPSEEESNPISSPEKGTESLEEIFPELPTSPSEEPGPPKTQPAAEAEVQHATVPTVESKSPQEEPPIPIPGTVDEEEKSKEPLVGTSEEEGLDLDAETLKPEGVFQVACIYPDGEEKNGQFFVKQLREAGYRSKKKMDIKAVFVQSWSKEGIDVDSWEKTAALSGSDYTFILASRKEQSLFQKQVTESRQKLWKGRVVFIEQVKMKSLYADIMIKLGQVS